MVPEVEGSRPFVRPFFLRIAPLNILEATILGIIQGLTEFLPISSSGHLKLVEYFLGFENLDQYIPFDVACHTGTLLAIFWVFAKEIREIFTKNHTKLLQIILGTLPLLPCILFLKQIKSLFNELHLLGIFFLITSLLLFLATRFGWEKSKPQLEQSRWWDPIIIGFFQAMALLPGVSRSGSTIAGARLLGWPAEQAISFSFLLAIPAILGGMTIESMSLAFGSQQVISVSLGAYLAGFFTSFLVGLASLHLLIKLAMKNRFMYFVWYTLILGIMVLLYFNA